MQRYREYGPWLRETLGVKAQKISINAGFTCPNRDGKAGTGGCTYCNNQTFNPAYCKPEKSVSQQLEEGKAFFAGKCSGQYLAYFQAYTNTYGNIEELSRKYEEALSVDGVVGLIIGTRPDCMPDELLNYLAQLNRRTFLVVEYGVESTDNSVLRRINRGHDFACAERAIIRTAGHGILTGAHIILGLPGDSHDNMMREAETLSSLPISMLKIHQLQLIKGTRMAAEYAARPEDFHLFSADEYVDLAIDFVERLRPDIVLDRFVSQSPSSLLAVPGWGIKNYEFVEKVRRRMEERNTWQGRLYPAPSAK